jgi:hypothetical protein
MIQYWSWILAVIGVIGIYFVGRKNRWAWLWLIFNECFWIVYAVITDQYGFILAAVAYSAVYIKSFLHWRREESEEEPLYNEIHTHGHIDHRYIK